MDEREFLKSRFDGAERLLPFGIRTRTARLSDADRGEAEEIRLRVGHPPSLLFSEGERFLDGEPVSKRDIESVLEIATQASVHTAGASMRAGFITVCGGYRIGLCGSAVLREGEIVSVRHISSLAIRISREVKTAAAEVIKALCPKGEFVPTLIISPPGLGKTTLLRDLVRRLSDGDPELGIKGQRIALADERSEVAAVWEGLPQMDVGRRTDIMDACRKSEAVIMLLRAMNPQIIAVDEITAPEDVLSMVSAANCGVRLLATAHAESITDLKTRALYAQVLGIFKKVVVIEKTESGRHYDVFRTEDLV